MPLATWVKVTSRSDDDLGAAAALAFDAARGDVDAAPEGAGVGEERFEDQMVGDGAVVVGIAIDLHLGLAARPAPDDQFGAQEVVGVAQGHACAALERAKRRELVRQVVRENAVEVKVGEDLHQGLAGIGGDDQLVAAVAIDVAQGDAGAAGGAAEGRPCAAKVS